MTQAEKHLKEFYEEVDEFDSIEEFMDHDVFSLYPYEHGFVFSDGSILDISSNRDHRMIPRAEWQSEGIITYHISNSNFFIRINNIDKYNTNQEDVLKDIITTEDKNIIFDIYHNGELKLHNEVHDWYSFARQVNSYDINESTMSFKTFLYNRRKND